MAYQYGGYGGQPSYDYNAQQQYRGGQQFSAPPNFAAPPTRMNSDGRRDQQGFGDFAADGRRYDNRSGRAGLGADQGGRNLERDRQHIRENMQAAQPPTREEVARTIFVGGLGDDAPPDEAIEAVLRCAGKLRRWTRAKDSMDKKCRFGFAEFEDVDSLEAAKEVFGSGIEVPAFKDGKVVMLDGETPGPQMTKLLVVIDEQSSKYIDDWMSKRDESEDAKQFRIDIATDDLQRCVANLIDDGAFKANEYDMDATMNGYPPAEGENGESAEDELADIPVEMRATVAQEIKNFRERSNRRDEDRIAMEQQSIKPVNRLASPGPQSYTNGTRGVAGAPSGPRAQRGLTTNGYADLPPEDESDASDGELERRRKIRKEEELEKRFEEAERRWASREKTRASAAERDRVRQEGEEKDRTRDRDNMARKLEEFDDEEEERIGHEEYFFDRSNWHRKRQPRRQREAYEDELDRKQEDREKEDEERRMAASRGAADRFLAETGAELAARQGEPAGGAFKISLGGAATRKAPGQPRRMIADMAGLLEEEEDAAASGKAPARDKLAIAKAAEITATTAGADMTDEERITARQALAADIPMDADALFDRKVYWAHISQDLLDKEIRPFVERKIIEALGLQEDFLVELVMSGLRDHTTPRKLIKDLEQVLDDEAEGLVRKVWRLVVYFSEAKEGGLVQ